MFLSLTTKTFPYGYEDELTSFLPDGYEMDEDGNYRFEVGSGSKTIFTSHLDTACKDYRNVKHVFDGKYIRTDKKSILGADDKAGVTILLYMIENKIPGLYYFFVGEEVGCIGSTAASKRVEFFSNYNKMISFDRRGTTSIITHQSSKRTCSDEFAKSLSKEYGKLGMKLKADDTGVYTDSAEFAGVIPECTNISVGYYNEHTHDEHQDILFLEKLAQASLMVNWESLSVNRDPEKTEWKDYSYASYAGNFWSGGYSTFEQHQSTRRGKKNKKDKNRDKLSIDYGNNTKSRRFSDEDYYVSRYSEKTPDYYYSGGRKVYYNDLDNEMIDDIVIDNDNTFYLTKDKSTGMDSLVFTKPQDKGDYYSVIKKIVLDDRITSSEFKIIKEQCLDMAKEDDVNFAKRMESSLMSIDNI